MRNFGINLLTTAQTVIGKQDYQVKKWAGRARNANGYEIDTYDAPVDRSGSVQPVKRDQYQKMGLDYSKIYIQIWDEDLIELLDREQNADQIIFDGWAYTAMPDHDWNVSGGWNSVLAVRIKRA